MQEYRVSMYHPIATTGTLESVLRCGMMLASDFLWSEEETENN